MTIGIAIPNIGKYIDFLPKLLDNISKQTVLPKKVSIAMSEGKWTPDRIYPFEIETNCTHERRSMGQNFNIAVAALDTDIVTVMHGDDLMHPQRNEILLWAFANKEISAVVHNFKYGEDATDKLLTTHVPFPLVHHDYICKIVPNKIYPVNIQDDVDYLNGHITIRRKLFDKFRYSEEPQWFYDSDSEYTRRLVENGIYISYIPHALVLYRPTGVARTLHATA